MKKVLVLCSGNSIRSQMAEGYLKFFAKGLGIFFSAGIECVPLNPYAVRVMEEDNIQLGNHLSKVAETFRDVRFDYLITVCNEAQERIPEFLKYQEHIHLDIPDPAAFVGTEAETLAFFREVREMLKRHMLRFIGQQLLTAETTAEPA